MNDSTGRSDGQNPSTLLRGAGRLRLKVRGGHQPRSEPEVPEVIKQMAAYQSSLLI